VRGLGGAAGVLAARCCEKKELSDARVLGSGAFVEALLRQAGESAIKGESAEEILEEVCAAAGVTVAEIRSSSRIQRIAAARARYCYLAKEAGISGGILAKELGRNSGSISYLTGKGWGAEINN
jgi:putative transposase